VIRPRNQLIDDGWWRFAPFEMTLDRSSWNSRQNKSGAPYLARTGPAESIARKTWSDIPESGSSTDARYPAPRTSRRSYDG
jgi:hypothetical protein